MNKLFNNLTTWRIGHSIYRVKFVKDIKESKLLTGLTVLSDRKIYVKTLTEENEKVCDDALLDVLFHELLHALMQSFCLVEIVETTSRFIKKGEENEQKEDVDTDVMEELFVEQLNQRMLDLISSNISNFKTILKIKERINGKSETRTGKKAGKRTGNTSRRTHGNLHAGRTGRNGSDGHRRHPTGRKKAAAVRLEPGNNRRRRHKDR